MEKHFDIIIIGTGIGCTATTFALAPSGKKILILEQNAPPVHADSMPLLRLRKEDFGLLRYQDGVSPAWPIAYEDLESFYPEAERLYANGQKHSNVTLLTQAEAEKIETDRSGKKVTGVQVKHRKEQLEFSAEFVICSAGAVDSAALLLKSADSKNPKGLANSSGLVGKYLMRQNRSVLRVFHPFRKNPDFFQKSVEFNYYYLGSRNGPIGHSRNPVPVGSIRLLGTRKRGWTAEHFERWMLTTEDLPKPENSVTVTSGGKVHLNYVPNNLAPHKELIYAYKRVLKKSGLGMILAKAVPASGGEIQLGTTVFGKDPSKSVLDIWCRSHDHDNLYVVDGGFFPSSSAINPALTIAAQTLRAAEHLKGRLGIPKSGLVVST